jgi:8-oxo-dGTP pyrophosphatase MutT (NUDIX family)
MTSLDVRTVLLLNHPDRRRVLLLRRSPHKKLFPNLITGIGGAVELQRGEGDDLEAAMLRELAEETHIPSSVVSDLKLRLSTILTRDSQQVLLLWFTGQFHQEPLDLSCAEGDLAFFDRSDLPLADMVPTARHAIPFVLSLRDDDDRVHNGIFTADVRLITTR